MGPGRIVIMLLGRSGSRDEWDVMTVMCDREHSVNTGVGMRYRLPEHWLSVAFDLLSDVD